MLCGNHKAVVMYSLCSSAALTGLITVHKRKEVIKSAAPKNNAFNRLVHSLVSSASKICKHPEFFISVNILKSLLPLV